MFPLWESVRRLEKITHGLGIYQGVSRTWLWTNHQLENGGLSHHPSKFSRELGRRRNSVTDGES